MSPGTRIPIWSVVFLLLYGIAIVDFTGDAENPCQYGGCHITQADGKRGCVCSPGLTGASCEEEVDECGSYPCNENEECKDGLNKYECLCLPGFTGDRCQSRKETNYFCARNKHCLSPKIGCEAVDFNSDVSQKDLYNKLQSMTLALENLEKKTENLEKKTENLEKKTENLEKKPENLEIKVNWVLGLVVILVFITIGIFILIFSVVCGCRYGHRLSDVSRSIRSRDPGSIRDED